MQQPQHNKALHPTAYSSVPCARASLRSLRFRRRVSLVVAAQRAALQKLRHQKARLFHRFLSLRVLDVRVRKAQSFSQNLFTLRHCAFCATDSGKARFFFARRVLISFCFVVEPRTSSTRSCQNHTTQSCTQVAQRKVATSAVIATQISKLRCNKALHPTAYSSVRYALSACGGG